MKSKKKLPLLFGTLAAGVVCLTLGVGVLGATPVPQTPLQQTTASPLGLNPETDPVIMTTADGLEIKLGGTLTNTNLDGYAYFTTSGKDGTVNWIIIGYNGDISGQYPDGADIITVNTFDKYATIEGHSDYTRSVDTITDQPLSQSPLKDAFSDNSEILSEISGDNVTYYKVNYLKQFEKTLDEFTPAIVANPSGDAQQKAAAQDLKEPGQVLCLSENILFNERFENGDKSYNSVYGENYDLYKAMKAIAKSETYTNYDNTTRSCDYGLGALGLNGIDTNGKIMPQTLYTADNGNANASEITGDRVLNNQYLFPLACVHNVTIASQGTGYTKQNFLLESYFDYTNSSGGTWSSGAYYFLNAKAGQKPAENQDYSASTWWLRSGKSDGSYYACFVDNTGYSNSGTVNISRGVRPAFVMDLDPRSYEITFELNGGVMDGDTTTSVTLPAGADLPTPTNGDMIFEGWYLGTDDTTTYTHVSKSFGANNSNITLTAKWKVPIPWTTEGVYYMNSGESASTTPTFASDGNGGIHYPAWAGYKWVWFGGDANFNGGTACSSAYDTNAVRWMIIGAGLDVGSDYIPASGTTGVPTYAFSSNPDLGTGEILLFSEKVLENKKWDSGGYYDCVWKNSSLYSYLNGGFISTYLSDSNGKAIDIAEQTNIHSYDDGEGADNLTDNKVFLLAAGGASDNGSSLEQFKVLTYLNSISDAKFKTWSALNDGSIYSYWLRSVCYKDRDDAYFASYINSGGSLSHSIVSVNYYGVRPAFVLQV